MEIDFDASARPAGTRLAVALAALLAVGTALLTTTQSRAAEPEDLIEETTLDNGLKVISIYDPSLPIATVEIAIRHGAFAESPEYDGLSHLYEHMFFKGNDALPNQEAYLDRLRELGIVFNGTTSTERVNYFYTLPVSNVKAGLEVMKHSITSPKFDTREFAKEKKIVLSEYDRAESQPQYAFSRQMQRLLWYEHPSRKITLGSREAIESATIDQMKTIQERYYVPNNAALMIAGDVKPERAFELAKSVYGDWTKGQDPYEAHPVPDHPPLENHEYLVQTGDVKVPSIELRWQGPSVDEDPKATYAADVLSFILGQPTSQFQKDLVDSGIALNANLSYYTQKHTGPINASASANTKQLKEAIRTLLREIHELDDPNYYTDEQLENAKTILEARDIYGREKTSSFAHTVTFWWAVDDLDYYTGYVDNLKEVTRQDIADYVSEYVIGEPFVLGVLLNSKAKEKLGLSEKDLKTMVREVRSEMTSKATSSTEASEASANASP
jgi:zinc protease